MRRDIDDDLTGIAWWNSLSQASRKQWLQRTGSGRPKEAWEACKIEQEIFELLAKAGGGDDRAGDVSLG